MSNKKIGLWLIFIYLVAVFLRFWFVKDGSFAFGFDQARDAVYAQEILDGNLKIFGPTASGTNDTIFHGALYYYVLAGLHLFTHDPIKVDILLGVVSALSIFPIYLLAQAFSKNKALSLVAAFLAAVSFEQITAGTWLSNPALAVLTLPWFFYFSYRLIQKFELKWMVGMMLFLGLSTQAIFFEVYWLLIPVFIFVHQLRKNDWHFKLEQLRLWLIGGLVLLISVSSMILAEILMIKRGILTLEVLGNFNNGALSSPFQLLLQITALWINKVSSSLSPRLGLLLGLVMAFYVGRSKLKHKLSWLGALLVTPLVFLLIYYRDNPHLLIGYESLWYVLSILLLADLKKNLKIKWLGNLVVGGFLVMFVLLNAGGLAQIKKTHSHPNSVQKGLCMLIKSY